MQHRVVVVGVLGLLFAGASRAELASIDLDAPGDGLLSRDTASGLDWLALGATAGLSGQALRAGAGGWVERGFRHATSAEVCALLAPYAAAPDPCPGRWAARVPSGAAAELITALAPNLVQAGSAGWIGIFEDPTPEGPRTGRAVLRRSRGHARAWVRRGRRPPHPRRPGVGHLLVRRHLTVYGRPGSFGEQAAVLPSGLPLAQVGVEGFAVEPGQSLYLPDTSSDGTLFLANVTQSYNQFVQLACGSVVTCFNPDDAVCRDPESGGATHFANLRIPNRLGSPYSPAGAAGEDCDALELGRAAGADTSDVLVVGRGRGERVLANSFLGSLSPGAVSPEFYPAWNVIRKRGGVWGLDAGAARFAIDLQTLERPASGEVCRQGSLPLCSAELECPGAEGCDFSESFTFLGVEYGRCELACTSDAECPAGLRCGAGGACATVDCGGFNELALLPRSGHVVVTLYTRGGLAVLDREGRILAGFEQPGSVPNPCLAEDPEAAPELLLPVREVEADPTSRPGDERFTVAYDSVAFGRGGLVQEFRYRAATRQRPAAIEPVTAPFIPRARTRLPGSCTGGRRSAPVVAYDAAGNLWFQLGGVFRVDPAVVFLRDPETGRRSLEDRCPLLDPDSGAPRPLGLDCSADLDVGAARSPDLASFGIPWSPHIFQDPWSGVMFSVGLRADLAVVRSFVTPEGAQLFVSPPPLDLGARQLPLAPDTGIWAWKAAPHPMLREFFVPIGVFSTDLDVGVARDNWVYRIGVDSVLEAAPRLLAADAPPRSFAGQAVPISLTVDMTGPLAGAASALFVAGDGSLERVAEWQRSCSASGEACTYDAEIPASVGAGQQEPLRWHALLHTATGSLHVAGRVEMGAEGRGHEPKGSGRRARPIVSARERLPRPARP